MSNTIYRTEKSQIKYQAHYDRLIANGKARASTRKEANLLLGYNEKHHIIPICLNGPDISENWVFLTPEEHYVAHQLLVMIYPRNPGLIFALSFMCIDAHGNRINNKQFGWIKRISTQIRNGQTKENCDWMARSALNRTGHRKETHSYLQQRSDDYRLLTDAQRDEIVRMRDELRFEFKEIQKEIKKFSNTEIAYQTVIGNYHTRKLQLDNNYKKSTKFGCRVLTNEQCLLVVKLLDVQKLLLHEVVEILKKDGVIISSNTIFGIYHRMKKTLNPAYEPISLKNQRCFSLVETEMVTSHLTLSNSYQKSWTWFRTLGYEISYSKFYRLFRMDK